MGKQKLPRFTEEFKREAVRILITSGRTVAQVADDLGVGKSTLGKWKHDVNEAELLAGPHDDVEKELARLRRENELLRQERELLKKATAFFVRQAEPSSTGRRSRLRQVGGAVFDSGLRQVDEIQTDRREEG